jgi:hypothetical protein
MVKFHPIQNHDENNRTGQVLYSLNPLLANGGAAALVSASVAAIHRAAVLTSAWWWRWWGHVGPMTVGRWQIPMCRVVGARVPGKNFLAASCHRQTVRLGETAACVLGRARLVALAVSASARVTHLSVLCLHFTVHPLQVIARRARQCRLAVGVITSVGRRSTAP